MTRSKLTYLLFSITFVFIVCSFIFASFIKYHFDGGVRYKSLQKTALFLASVPYNIFKIIENRTFDLNKPPKLKKHKDKNRLEQFINQKRNALLILPRYDHYLNRAIVEIVDLNDFKVIHTYKHDISEMLNKFKGQKEFESLYIDHSPNRFQYLHPLILEDGSLISRFGPSFKIDFCSNLKWVTKESIYHHSLMLDHEANIWIGGKIQDHSKYVKKYKISKNFMDDSISKIDSDGNLLYNKSIIELLIENKIVPKNFALNSALSGELDPIHLNDIEPSWKDTKYWKKGDLFISIRNQSAIIHYRPNTKKVINYLTGPFAEQHDVDIISDKEISIFNNNNFFVNNKFSEIIIYNFETKKFRTLFNKQLQKENFKTISQGLSHIFNDGSLMVEEQNHGRIILFDKNGQKEWEFVNKDVNGNIGFVKWSRIIEDQNLINKIKSLVASNKCK